MRVANTSESEALYALSGDLFADALSHPLSNSLRWRKLLYPVIGVVPDAAFHSLFDAFRANALACVQLPLAPHLDQITILGRSEFDAYRDVVRYMPEHLLLEPSGACIVYVSREDFAIVGSGDVAGGNAWRDGFLDRDVVGEFVDDLIDAASHGDDVRWGVGLLGYVNETDAAAELSRRLEHREDGGPDSQGR